MKIPLRMLGLLCSAAIFLCLVGAASYRDAEEPAGKGLSFALAPAEGMSLSSDSWTDRVVVIPGPDSVEKRGVPSLVTFTRTILVGRKAYRFTMVGSDPFVARSRQVVVPLQIVPVRLVFNDGVALDPTLPLASCAGAGTPLANTLQSPLFLDHDYGEGPRQYEEENRRAEFWAYTRTNPSSSLRVGPVVFPTITLTYDGPSISVPCGRAGIVPLGSLDYVIRTSLIPQLKKSGVSPKTFPLFLFVNVNFQYSQSGFAAGYHTAFSSGGMQTYGVAEYEATQYDPRHYSDISILAHEIGEWYDDPYGNNATPPWGHIGQVSGCQANLEVGDPLSGSLFEIPMPNGLKYHPQELAFFSWFFDQSPSLGLGGYYSWGHTFTSPAILCK